MIRFLLDANLSPETATFLANTFGFDTAALATRGLGHLGDAEVADLAGSEHRIVVPFDLDWGRLYHRWSGGGLGIIILRLQDQTVESVNRTLDDFVRNHAATIRLTRSLVLLDGQCVRVGPGAYHGAHAHGGPPNRPPRAAWLYLAAAGTPGACDGRGTHGRDRRHDQTTRTIIAATGRGHGVTESTLDRERLDRAAGTNPDPAVAPSSPNGAADPSPRGSGNGSGNGTDDAAPQPLGRRFLRPETLVSFVVAAVIIFFAVRSLRIDPAAVWANVRRADPVDLLAALAVWYGVFVLRALRWRGMLDRVGIDRAHGYAVPGLGGIYEILILSWFANCVVPAKLGDAYRCWLLKRESRAPFSTGLGTVLAERLSDLLVLCLAMAAAGAWLFGRNLPDEAFRTFELGLILVLVTIVGLIAMWFSRHALQRALPGRVREQYGRLHGAVFGSLRRPLPVVAVGVVIWLAEGLRFWLVARSLDAEVSFAVALFIALMGALLTAIPFTPAGLGVVEAGTGAVMVGVLGLNADLSFAIILLDRVVSYWSLIAIGLVVYLRRFGREARQAAERAPA